MELSLPVGWNSPLSNMQWELGSHSSYNFQVDDEDQQTTSTCQESSFASDIDLATRSDSIGWESEHSEPTTEIDESHPFFWFKGAIVTEMLLRYYQGKTVDPDQDQSSQPPRSQGIDTITPSSMTSSSQPGQKRKPDDDGDDGKDNDEERPRKRRVPSDKNPATKAGKCFSCPFAKKDPLKHRRCFSYIISRIQDVKLHLTRYHQRPIFCSRCKDIFETEDDLNEHAEKPIGCLPRSNVMHEGVTRAQQDQLRRKSDSKLSVEDQWYEIYKVLFGDLKRPKSVYVDLELTMELRGFVALMQTDGVDMIMKKLEDSGIKIEHEEDNAFSLLSAAISDGLHEVADRWMSSSKLRTPPSNRSETSNSITGIQSTGTERQQSPGNCSIEQPAGKPVLEHKPPVLLPQNAPQNDQAASVPSPPAPSFSFDATQASSSLENLDVVDQEVNDLIDFSDPSLFDFPTFLQTAGNDFDISALLSGQGER